MKDCLKNRERLEGNRFEWYGIRAFFSQYLYRLRESRMSETRPSIRSSSAKTYAFGSYSLDLDRARLMRDQEEIKLRPKSFEVLRYLVENSGRLIPKSELIQAVWRDTFVTDDSLVQCVRDVRRALNDSSQEYIKTVTGRGYIFEAAVTNGDPIAKQVTTEPTTTPQTQTLPSQKPARTLWYGIVAAIALVSGLTTLYLWSKHDPVIWHSVPLTSYPGIEKNPALSPDGNFVAFAWDGEEQENVDSHVLPVQSGYPQRLTTDPAEDMSAAWSRDGRTISFLRRLRGDRREVFLVPATGGPERKLTEIREAVDRSAEDRNSPMAWTADGK